MSRAGIVDNDDDGVTICVCRTCVQIWARPYWLEIPTGAGRATYRRRVASSLHSRAHSTAQHIVIVSQSAFGAEGVICVADDKQSLLVIHTPSAAAAVAQAEGGSGRN